MVKEGVTQSSRSKGLPLTAASDNMLSEWQSIGCVSAGLPPAIKSTEGLRIGDLAGGRPRSRDLLNMRAPLQGKKRLLN